MTVTPEMIDAICDEAVELSKREAGTPWQTAYHAAMLTRAAMSQASPPPLSDEVALDKLKALRVMVGCCNQPLYAQILDEVLAALSSCRIGGDDLGKLAYEHHKATTCACVAAERYVSDCPEHGEALSLHKADRHD